MNFDVLIGKETEVKNKVELKSWFEDDKLYVGEYVKHKINQLDEPEVTLDKAFEKVAESYSMTKEEVCRRIEWFENHTEVLSQDWINKFTSPVDDEGRLYVWKSDLQNLLVPKQEEITEVEEEPLYYAKIKGWEHVGTSSYYFGYDEDNDSLEVTYLESNYSFAFSLTKEHWNKLGINDTNADFV